jgi:hypothetical protein
MFKLCGPGIFGPRFFFHLGVSVYNSACS